MKNKKMKFYILVLFVSVVTLAACKSSSNLHTGKVKNLTGFDGCGLLIELENGKYLQPFEIVPEFKLEEGQKVKFSFELIKGVGSTCMKGEIVRITKIKAIHTD